MRNSIQFIEDAEAPNKTTSNRPIDISMVSNDECKGSTFLLSFAHFICTYLSGTKSLLSLLVVIGKEILFALLDYARRI